jgi:hypothetical protein
MLDGIQKLIVQPEHKPLDHHHLRGIQVLELFLQNLLSTGMCEKIVAQL